MNILLTQDYELYFGSSGSAKQCMLEPTERLLNLCEKHGAHMTFFVDAGYFWRLEQDVAQFPALQEEYEKGVAQLKKMQSLGHQIALHIHPHWEDSFYSKTGWQMNVKRYKLADFTVDEIDGIFYRYKHCLEEIIQEKIDCYRAGGWCLQPFAKVEEAFKSYGIRIDSSAYYGGFQNNDAYFFDFRQMPNKDCYAFSRDLCMEDENGPFLEFPIASERLSPLFFWRLFVLGRLFPLWHKPLGDGFPVPVKGFRKKVLLAKSLHCVSSDGYFVTRLPKVLKRAAQRQQKYLVIIGHPKACTLFSLKKLEKFVAKNARSHNFTTYKALGV